MARRTAQDPGPAVELPEPPCQDGAAAVDGWAQRCRMALGAGPRAEAVARCLDLLSGTSRAAQDSEAVLRLRETGAQEARSGRIDGAAEAQPGATPARSLVDAALCGGEAPDDPVGLALWQWCEAARQCWLAATGGEWVVEAACAEARRLCRAVSKRPLAPYDEAQRRFRAKDLRGAVAEAEESRRRLAEEHLEDGQVEAARRSLCAYGHWVQRHFLSPRHVQIIADALERVERGECRRLIIEVSPRHGKSNMTTVLFASWYLGKHPDRDVIAASSSQDLANTFGRQVRDIVQSDAYRRVFPGVHADGDSMHYFRMQTDEGWVGTDGQRGGQRMRRGTYQVLGRKTKASGRGASLLLIDDLVDEKEADSESAQAEARRAVQALRSRLAPESEGAAWVIINTRYREDDVIGYVEEEFAADGPWEKIRLPAWTDEPEDVPLPDGTVWHRQAGEALWPERYTAEELLRVREYLLRTSPRDWWAQFCCLIVPGSGAVIEVAAWFDRRADGTSRRYRAQPMAVRQRANRVAVSVDTSKGAGPKAARTGIEVWAELSGFGEEDGAYILWAWAEAVLAPQQIEAIKGVCDKWRPYCLLIEDKSTAEAVIPLLRADPSWVRTPIHPVAVCRNKEERMSLASPQMRDGQVWIPDKSLGLPWVADLEREWTFFPRGKLKDLVDTTSQYLNWRRENPLRGGTPVSGGSAQQSLQRALGGAWGRPGSGWGRPANH